MTINDLIEQLQCLPMKDRPIYVRRTERDQYDKRRKSAYPCRINMAVDEGPYAVIEPWDEWIVKSN